MIKEQLLNKLIQNYMSPSKTRILTAISQEINTLDLLSEKLGESKPNLAFHMNGSCKKREGLIEMGLVKKTITKQNYKKLKYEITLLGIHVLKTVK